MNKENGLPEGWDITPISNVAQIISGGTPNSKDESNFAEKGKGIAWITPADLSKYNAMYISNGARDLTEKGYKSCSARLMPKGSVLLSSRAPIGYLVIAKNDISTNQGFKSFVFDETICSEYAYFYLKSIKSFIESLGSGTTFKEISATNAKTIPFIKPPLPTQQKIAQKLTALLDEVEQIKKQLEQIPVLLKTFRQSVLAKAVSGELSAAWREENGVSFESWESVKIEDIATISPKKEKLDDEMIVSFSSMHRMSELFLEPLGFEEKKWGEVKKGFTFFKDNDVLLAKITPCFENGKSAVAKNLINGIGTGSTEFMVFRCNEKILPEFLYSHFNTAYFKQQGALNMTGSVGHKRVPKEFVLSWEIKLPSKQEQHYITQTIERYFTAADEIENQANAALARVNLLTQAILAKAFRGEL